MYYDVLLLGITANVRISLSAGSNALYLSVYSEYGVDVFDIHTAEWVQTISLRKVP